MAVSIITPLSAQKRGVSRIYFLQQCTESVISDGYVNVKYTITNEILNANNPLEQPRLQIDITNISDETIILDIDKSQYKMNVYEESLSKHINKWETTLSPGECYSIVGINMLPYEAKSYATDVYWYWNFLKVPHAVASDDNLLKDDKVTYDESNTPITIGSSIVYHSENDPTEYVINTKYHAFMKLAPGFTFDNDKYLNNEFPHWRRDNILILEIRRVLAKQK